MRKISVILFLSFLLSGCLVPEDFSAEINVAPDASYTFKYSGITAYTVAMAKKSSLERDAAIYRADAEKMMRRPEFKKAEYLNNGRYNLEIEYRKKPGETLKMFDVFSVSTDNSGVTTVTSQLIKPGDRQQIENMGVQIKGRLSVRLPANVEVIEHNADSTPYFFGLLGDYSWHIDGLEQQPLIRFKVNQ
jgi:hypothetical protein